MISKLLPILLALVGLGIGVGAGIFLRPAHEPATEHSGEGAVAEASGEPGAAPTEGAETPKEHAGDAVYAREPKLRDALLQVLFDHANSGGFRGSFTDGANMILLRKALLEAAQSHVGEIVTGVLISDIARQDS